MQDNGSWLRADRLALDLPLALFALLVAALYLAGPLLDALALANGALAS